MRMKKFNVGCGSWDFGAGWTNVDALQMPHIDSHDIYLGEYKRESIDLIYASHLIQYFDGTEALDLLREWYKKLKVGGKLRISVPDIVKLIAVYERGALADILGPLYGKMRMGDKWIYHKIVYDWHSLNFLLQACGFRKKNIMVTDPWYKYDDCSKAEISLNMEAIK